MSEQDKFTNPYINTEWDDFPGARDRSRPGEGPKEQKYGQVRDAKGNLVSNKPANKGLLASQRRRLEHEQNLAAKAAAKAAAASSPTGSNRTDGGMANSRYTTLFLLFLFLPLLSSFLTGTSYTFHLSPYVLPPLARWWRLTPLNPFRVQLRSFTPAELARYDGSDEARPVYLAVGGEVYDVSSNRRIYGPGGSYSMMAGRDASRAFITGCFQDHLTHDLRGITPDELKALDNWKSFFSNHAKYTHVGHIDNPPIDPHSPVPPDCRTAASHEQGGGAPPVGPLPGPVRATGT